MNPTVTCKFTIVFAVKLNKLCSVFSRGKLFSIVGITLYTPALGKIVSHRRAGFTLNVTVLLPRIQFTLRNLLDRQSTKCAAVCSRVLAFLGMSSDFKPSVVK